jgi:hypothetical protein
MLEAGIVSLVQADPVVTGLCPVGGFLETLPKDLPRPSWTYRMISDQSDWCLRGEHGFVKRRVQIDCFGDAAKDAVALARAIDRVLRGYQGILPDPEATIVFGCFRSDLMDPPFDAAARSYRRMLEYEIDFCEV